MNGLIFSIKRYAVHDGPGIRTTVFFKGCPLNCWWCHNPESQNVKSEEILKKYTLGKKEISEHQKIGYVSDVESLMKEILKDRLFFDESGGGVTFSGGEPLMQFDFLLEVLKKCKEEEIHTCIDTSGFCSAAKLLKIIPYVDLFLYDIKHLDEAEHIKFTGVTNKPILRNLELLIENNANIRIRFPLVPGINDSADNLANMIIFFKNHSQLKYLDILPYHNIAGHKYEETGKINKLKDLKEPDSEYIEKIKAMFEQVVPNVKIGG